MIDDGEFDRIFSGLEFMKSLVNQEPDQKTQHKLDLIYRGLNSELHELEKRIANLDEELRQSV